MNGHKVAPSASSPAAAPVPMPPVIPGDPDAKISLTRGMLMERLDAMRMQRQHLIDGANRIQGIIMEYESFLRQIDAAEKAMIDKAAAEPVDDPLGR